MSASVNCLRCGTPCRVGTPKAESKPFRQAAERGLCPNCMVTSFLLSVEPVREKITKEGPEILFASDGFHHAFVKQFAAVLYAGNCQMNPDEIDWIEVVGNWGLPFPKVKGCQPELF